MLTKNNQFPDIAELLPHKGSMILLDRIVSLEEGRLVAAVDLANTSAFRDHMGRVPSYVGIEYLVQAVSAVGGIAGRARGLPPRIGLLLGARRYEAVTPYFPTDGELIVSVREHFVEEPIGVFFGELSHEGKLLASGEIKAIQPESEEALAQIFDAQ